MRRFTHGQRCLEVSVRGEQEESGGAPSAVSCSVIASLPVILGMGGVSGSHFEEYKDEGRSEEREPSSRSEPTGLYRRLGLIQPESHVHFAVHRDRGRKVFAGLLMLACASVELAEAEVAVGDNRTHA